MFHCLNCLKEYPNKWIIDGKTYYIYDDIDKRGQRKRAYCYNCRPVGDKSRKKLKLQHRQIKKCCKCHQEQDIKMFGRRGINDSTPRSECNKCKSRMNTIYARKIKEESVAYKGGKCERCGYNKCIKALDFHHKNPEHKCFNISTKYWSFQRLKDELDKCELLCANCHREISYKTDW